MVWAVAATVLLSVVAHGMMALPGIKLSARQVDKLPPDVQHCSQNLLLGIASANLLLKKIPESQELFSLTRTGDPR